MVRLAFYPKPSPFHQIWAKVIKDVKTCVSNPVGPHPPGGTFVISGRLDRRRLLQMMSFHHKGDGYCVRLGMIISRGKQREKLIEGLTDWLKAGKSLEAIEATKDRKKWRTMIANAVKQGT
ncbi:hypothetical protein PoB_006603400 [Plakobranchus ocellatus]|uniref:Uncharacterized protein n=1 Tax=Plakobranchus ocellatus TaxID=259542 RepID=A0AAV4D5S6_9GAST|nr:hypothetical protein PoB_006603400 [Plakobranchus ocellatus]